MLNDSENESLREIQRSLVDDDPNFAESFRDIEKTPVRSQYRSAFVGLIALLMLMSLLMAYAGQPGEAFMFAAIAGISLLWRHRAQLLEWANTPPNTPPK